MQHLYWRIHADPEFHELERKRGRFSWLLSAIVLLSYFCFILVIAFAPGLFATPILTGGIITWGILAGLLIIFLSFILTGVYVYRANTEFDHLIQDIVENVRKAEDAQV